MSVTDNRIGFVASVDLIRAIDSASANLGITRSAFIRSRIAQYLRDEGSFPPKAPTCKYEARFRAGK